MRKRLTTSAGQVSYLEAGVPTLDRTLVLLHAFPLNAEMWEPQLAAGPSGWRVLAPDFPGLGQSQETRSPSSSDTDAILPSIDDYASAVLDLLDRLNIERAVIGGLSMGGYAAFAVFRRAASRVAGLILADTRSQADSEKAAADRQRLLELLASSGPDALAEDMLPKLLGTTSRASRPNLVERVRRLVRANSADGLAAAIRRLRSRPDSTPLLASIACPTLIVAGEEDEVTPVAAARAMHAAIAGAELALVPRAGHLSSLEQPDIFNAALDRFLGSRL